MWDIIKELISQPPLYMFSIMVIIVLAQKGMFRIHTDKFTIGKSDRQDERLIVSAQINAALLETEAIAAEMELKYPEFGHWHISYVLEKCADELIRRVCVNYMTDDKVYIEDVYLTLLSIIRKRCHAPLFYTEEFEKYCYEKTEHIVKRLYDLRKRMTKVKT